MNQLQMLKKALIAYVNSVKAVWSAIAYPLSIVSKRKGNLKDYRIYGTENGVGKIVTDGEYAGKYKVPVTVRGKNFINKDNITITPKNRRLYEKNGDLITIQGNEGASQYASSGGTLQFEFSDTYPSGKKYTFSIYVTLLEEGIWGTGMRIYAGAPSSFQDKTFTFSSNPIGVRKKLKFTSDFTNGIKGCVFRLNGCKWLIEIDTLQLENGDTATECEPYIEPQIVNIYLDEPLETGEVVQQSVDGLPSLPQFKGTTIYEVQTEVPPSGMEVCYYE